MEWKYFQEGRKGVRPSEAPGIVLMPGTGAASAWSMRVSGGAPDLWKQTGRGCVGRTTLVSSHPVLRPGSLQPPPKCEIVCHLRGKDKDKLDLFYLEASAFPHRRS